MSSFADRVAVARAFLINRASLGRASNYRELIRVIGTHTGGRRRHVNRDKVAEILRAVDDASLADKGILLSALVVHFWDNEAGHRFFDQVAERELLLAEPDDQDARKIFHAEQVVKCFEAYPEIQPFWLRDETPDDASEIDEEAESVQSLD